MSGGRPAAVSRVCPPIISPAADRGPTDRTWCSARCFEVAGSRFRENSGGDANGLPLERPSEFSCIRSPAFAPSRIGFSPSGALADSGGRVILRCATQLEPAELCDLVRRRDRRRLPFGPGVCSECRNLQASSADGSHVRQFLCTANGGTVVLSARNRAPPPASRLPPSGYSLQPANCLPSGAASGCPTR